MSTEEIKEIEEHPTLGTVPIADIRLALKQVEEFYDKLPEPLPKHKRCVSFEYIIGSFFPQVLDNIRAEMTKQYALGYEAGLEAQNANQGDN